ncbi:MAG: (Fe-S)-binding protein [Bacteroidaceae bacterium]|nr:(Fe-S)-binding protein [Bacteroidaceae bacterium]
MPHQTNPTQNGELKSPHHPTNNIQPIAPPIQLPCLHFHKTQRHIALHLTCSTRLMGLSDELIALARLCSDHVFLPEGVGCCGFAGDKGFTHPEMNRYALHKLRPQIEANCIEVGYSNSRTCEVGLQANTGIPYMNIAYLVNECTTAALPV